jgi:hypothetical protein
MSRQRDPRGRASHPNGIFFSANLEFSFFLFIRMVEVDDETREIVVLVTRMVFFFLNLEFGNLEFSFYFKEWWRSRQRDPRSSCKSPEWYFFNKFGLFFFFHGGSDDEIVVQFTRNLFPELLFFIFKFPASFLKIIKLLVSN